MRSAAVLLLLGGLTGYGQSPALPATRPTQLPASAGVAASTAVVPERHLAEVVYSKGLLEVRADNSSLNQILREIARETGMTITGGVTDQRVFGKYGPGRPADILAGLLDGTGSNMLLRETASKAPAELILTPRQGGPTPPNPNAAGMDDDRQQNDEQVPNGDRLRPPRPGGMGMGEARSQPEQAAPATPMVTPPPADNNTTPPPSGIVDAPTYQPPPEPGSAPAANPQSPNGVKTPQQIYQELQQLQNQQPPRD
jgi:hypothetical protein